MLPFSFGRHWQMMLSCQKKTLVCVVLEGDDKLCILLFNLEDPTMASISHDVLVALGIT